MKRLNILDIMSGKSMAADPTKITTILKWPVLRTLCELQVFLELTDYYQKFMKVYGKNAYPMVKQLKKYNFLWTMTTITTF